LSTGQLLLDASVPEYRLARNELIAHAIRMEADQFSGAQMQSTERLQTTYLATQ
jgi:hypothetical protein